MKSLIFFFVVFLMLGFCESQEDGVSAADIFRRARELFEMGKLIESRQLFQYVFFLFLFLLFFLLPFYFWRFFKLKIVKQKSKSDKGRRLIMHYKEQTIKKKFSLKKRYIKNWKNKWINFILKNSLSKGFNFQIFLLLFLLLKNNFKIDKKLSIFYCIFPFSLSSLSFSVIEEQLQNIGFSLFSSLFSLLFFFSLFFFLFSFFSFFSQIKNRKGRELHPNDMSLHLYICRFFFLFSFCYSLFK